MPWAVWSYLVQENITACTVTDDGKNLKILNIEDNCSPCGKSKGADQLGSYCAHFCIGKNVSISHAMAHISAVIYLYQLYQESLLEAVNKLDAFFL